MVKAYVIHKNGTLYAVGRSPAAAWRAFSGWRLSHVNAVAQYYPQGFRVREYQPTLAGRVLEVLKG